MCTAVFARTFLQYRGAVEKGSMRTGDSTSSLIVTQQIDPTERHVSFVLDRSLVPVENVYGPVTAPGQRQRVHRIVHVQIVHALVARGQTLRTVERRLHLRVQETPDVAGRWAVEP